MSDRVFARDDFERLAAQLSDISGRFILSINDTPGSRTVFGHFDVEAVPVTYTLGTASGGAQRAGELIVRG